MNKASFLRLIKSISFAILVLLLSTSCRFFTQPDIGDLLDDWTGHVLISKSEYQKDYPYDKDSVLSIPSNRDVEIKYLIQNPVQLNLDYTLQLNSTGNENYPDFKIFTDYYNGKYGDADGTPDYWYETSMSAASDVITLSLPKQLLYRMELNEIPFEISPSLTISDKNTSSPYTFLTTDFSEKLRVNSPPPPVQGGCVMVDTSYAVEGVSDFGRYVLCFNLPYSLFDKYGVQRDVEKIYINGLSTSDSSSYEHGIELGINSDTYAYNLPSDKPASLVERNFYNSPDSGDGLPYVEFEPDKRPVYIVDTVDAEKGKEVDYSIILEDKYGLRSTVNISTNSAQLRPVSFFADGTEIASGDSVFPMSMDVNKFLSGILKAPTRTVGNNKTSVSDVDVVYEIYTVSDDGTMILVEDGYELNNYTYKFQNNSYYIRAYAHKSGYIDSVMTYWYIQVGPYHYVPVVVSCEADWRIEMMVTAPTVLLKEDFWKLYSRWKNTYKYKYRDNQEMLDKEGEKNLSTYEIHLEQPSEKNTYDYYTLLTYKPAVYRVYDDGHTEYCEDPENAEGFELSDPIIKLRTSGGSEVVLKPYDESNPYVVQIPKSVWYVEEDAVYDIEITQSIDSMEFYTTIPLYIK